MWLGITRHFLWLELVIHQRRDFSVAGIPTPLVPTLTCTQWEWPEPPSLCPASGTLGSQSHGEEGGGHGSNVAARFSDVTNHLASP